MPGGWGGAHGQLSPPARECPGWAWRRSLAQGPPELPPPLSGKAVLRPNLQGPFSSHFHPTMGPPDTEVVTL